MSDSTAIEAIVHALEDDAEIEAIAILGALRDAGFEIYRPDECITHEFDGQPVKTGWCCTHDYPALRYADGGIACWWEAAVEAAYGHKPDEFIPVRLVPVGGETK